VRRFRQLLPLIPDAEGKARWLLGFGVDMELAGHYASAIGYYREAMAIEPTSPETWYFIHNNIGYSLNQLGRFGEAETYCRTAIGILPERHNAHKNLGLALAGLDRRREAAQCFIEATRVCPENPRSCAHLEDLLEEHPELKVEFQESALECRAAVTAALLKQPPRPRPWW
jgi:tetratricopeptide (TPR) repeat protein